MKRGRGVDVPGCWRGSEEGCQGAEGPVRAFQPHLRHTCIRDGDVRNKEPVPDETVPSAFDSEFSLLIAIAAILALGLGERYLMPAFSASAPHLSTI